MVRPYWLASLALTGLGCDGASVSFEPVPAYVTLVTAGAVFDAGATSTVPVSLINHSSFTLGFGACTNMLLEQLTEAGWREVPAARNCTEEERLVGPGSQTTAHVPLPAETPAGAYRVRFRNIHVIMQYAPDDGLVPAAQLMTNVFAVR